MKNIRSFLSSYIGLLSTVAVAVISSIVLISRGLGTVESLFVNAIAILFITGLYAIFVPYNFSYYLSLFALLLFPAFSVIVWALQRVPSGRFLLIVSPIIAALLALSVVFHRKTYSWDLTGSSVYQLNMFLFLLFLWGAVLFSTIPGSAPQSSIDFFFFFGIVLYIFASIQITNITYRQRELNQKLRMNNRLKRFVEYRAVLERMIGDHNKRKKTQIEEILFYLKQSFDDFISGRFDESLLNAYKILFDQYPNGEYVFKDVYQIENYSERRSEYSSIRNNLVHPRNQEELTKTRKILFQKSLDLLKIAKLEYMDIIFKPSKSKDCTK